MSWGVMGCHGVSWGVMGFSGAPARQGTLRVIHSLLPFLLPILLPNSKLLLPNSFWRGRKENLLFSTPK